MAEINNFGEDADIKQAVTDLGIEYGLVTDYTSMLVMRDEVFEAQGIKRHNKKRLEKEKQAQQVRSQQTAVPHRVDKQQPMFNKNRPTYSSGGGAMGAWTLFVFIPFLLLKIKRRKS